MTSPETTRTGMDRSLAGMPSGMRSEVWLARAFLIAVAVAGFVSRISGASPENLALWPCPFHLIFGVECPGCGVTRACISLARGDIGMALHYNPFSLGLVLLAGGFAFIPNPIRRFWQGLPRNARTLATWSALVLVLGIWTYRLVLK